MKSFINSLYKRRLEQSFEEWLYIINGSYNSIKYKYYLSFKDFKSAFVNNVA